MLNDPDADGADTSTLRALRVGRRRRCPVEVMRAFEEKFGCKILEGYGL